MKKLNKCGIKTVVSSQSCEIVTKPQKINFFMLLFDEF